MLPLLTFSKDSQATLEGPIPTPDPAGWDPGLLVCLEEGHRVRTCGKVPPNACACACFCVYHCKSHPLRLLFTADIINIS